MGREVKHPSMEQVLEQGPGRQSVQEDHGKQDGGHAYDKALPGKKQDDRCINAQHRHRRNLAQALQHGVPEQPDITFLRSHVLRYAFSAAYVHFNSISILRAPHSKQIHFRWGAKSSYYRLFAALAASVRPPRLRGFYPEMTSALICSSKATASIGLTRDAQLVRQSLCPGSHGRLALPALEFDTASHHVGTNAARYRV